jgi:hypothetical protein
MQHNTPDTARSHVPPTPGGSHPVLTAVADALAHLGYNQICQAADTSNLEDAVVRALHPVRLLVPPEPTGSMREDLLGLLQHWLRCPTRQEQAIGVLLNAAAWHPSLHEAVAEALDRSLATALSASLTRAIDDRPSLEHAHRRLGLGDRL